MFLASNCTCAVSFTYTAHVQLLAQNMAATHVHSICIRICIRNQTNTLRFCREDNPLYVFTLCLDSQRISENPRVISHWLTMMLCKPLSNLLCVEHKLMYLFEYLMCIVRYLKTPDINSLQFFPKKNYAGLIVLAPTV